MNEILLAIAEVLDAGSRECYSTPFNTQRTLLGDTLRVMADKARELAVAN